VKTLLASAAVLALSMTAAHAEKLLFQDRNSIQDWWYSDENPDGSLTLSTRSNDPSVMPFYLICKGRPVQYSILFQPPVPPVKSVYLYRAPRTMPVSTHDWLSVQRPAVCVR
jgi:hypothetical protein